MSDAQTSGGLLLCITERNLPKALRLIERSSTPDAVVIGKIVPSRSPLVCMTK